MISMLKQLAFLLIATALPGAAAERPNILIAIADDWSFGHAGAYGCGWVKTPGFDRVAREGVLFTHAYTPNAKCAPSRSCILTGRNPWQLKAAANHVPFFPPEFRSYPEALGGLGYFVGFTMKGWAPGTALDAAGQPRMLTGKPFNARKLNPPTTGISRNDYAANFQDFLEAAPAGQPWCFWYGGVEPHRPYEYGSGVAKGGKKLSDIDHVPACWPDDKTVRNDLLDYAFEVEHFDRHLVRMLELLEQRGELAHTLVIVTSDNGMPFPRGKGNDYDYANHLPLAIMWYDGVARPGRTVDDYVSFIDFAPTMVEAAGAPWAETGMAPAQGRSLMELLRSPKSGRVVPERDHVLLGRERNDVGRPHDEGYPIRGIVKDDMLYLRNFEIGRWPAGNPETGYLDCDGGATKTDILAAHRADAANRFWGLCFGKRSEEEMFDLKQDPDCVRNLATSDAQRATMVQLREQMLDELKAQGDPRMFGQGHVFDEYPYSDERYRNFYERAGKDAKKPEWVSESDFEAMSLD